MLTLIGAKLIEALVFVTVIALGMLVGSWQKYNFKTSFLVNGGLFLIGIVCALFNHPVVFGSLVMLFTLGEILSSLALVAEDKLKRLTE